MKSVRHQFDPKPGERHGRRKGGDAPSVPAPLRNRIEDLDVVLAIFSAGLSARRDAATPGRADALTAVATTMADAASALAVEAATVITKGPGRRDADRIARAAAGLQVRAARLRLRLVEYRARADSRGRR